MKAAARLFDLSRRRGAGVEHRWGATCHSVTLVSPSLHRFPHLRAVEDDILLNTSYSRQFHALRAANILNLAYFDIPTLEKMVRNLRSRLLPGGLLICCRTNEEGVNHATIFTLEADGRLRAAARLNAGSEIESLVLGLAPECQ
jgi:hypothetical protein